ncbi:fructosamine kinase family protein [Rubrivirga sp.]|uniref:fructosamine kinase family protein n=1 Tax=Rubrivirga sp. TaxID=1885344 RepID=UPI003B529524
MTSSLPETVRQRIEAEVGAVASVTPVGGGDVSRAARVETAAGPVFAKWGEGAAGRTYAAEAEGLAALADAAGPDLTVPAPLAVRESDGDGPGVLVLPWIERGRPTSADWRRFGAALAALHRAPAPGDGYGWDADNWIGSKPQRNGWRASWPAFFGERRLRAQAETVRQRGAWDAAWDGPLDRMIERLGELLPETPPRSLLHGDLWAGNALPTADGRLAAPSPVAFAIIDPAVSVGHREADLAMTELFGGFSDAFYDGYRQAWPLDGPAGYADRREVYNLFHLIDHLTHGPGYRAPVERTLRRFG